MRQELTVVLAVVFFEGCVTLVYGLIHRQHVLHQSRPFQADAHSRVGVIEIPLERVALRHELLAQVLHDRLSTLVCTLHPARRRGGLTVHLNIFGKPLLFADLTLRLW